ncbi:PREDICTED: TMV resistance protein N-like [Ipomoea nil]|uniref:TMV resistance protein N-like n=1 Tax=Ipomoea nil TaxID=35883 RepID=UPI000901BA8C|nr:PREDICTED: TMV resistance protein N-like [Ipomoea nil]
MKRFYSISESFLQELLLSAALKCQKWLNHQVPTPHCAPKYSVFLNFRGRDTRHNFVHSLYETLCSTGITAFQDDKSVKKGDPIGRELFRAIDECRIAIVILSKNYAASEWCLEELVKIMKRKKRLTIFPVFYDVRPSEVRNLRGSFARAFAEHERNYESKPRKVEKWKKALCKAAGISGFDLRNYNGDESKCIQDIVEEVCKKLGATGREKYEGRKTVGKCKQKPKLRKQKRVKSQTRPHWRPNKLGRTMVARPEETPGRTAAQMGRTAVYPHTTISSMYSCDKKVVDFETDIGVAKDLQSVIPAHFKISIMYPFGKVKFHHHT